MQFKADAPHRFTTIADIVDFQRGTIRLLRQSQGQVQSGSWTEAILLIRTALRNAEELASL